MNKPEWYPEYLRLTYAESPAVKESLLKAADIMQNLIEENKVLKGMLAASMKIVEFKHDPTQCRYYMKDVYHKQGCCLGTKEIDPCDGPDCKRWKPKEDA